MRGARIILPEDPVPLQEVLFKPPSVSVRKYDPFPRLSQSEEDFRKVLADTPGPLGIDFEFRPGYDPSITGIASRSTAVALPWDEGLCREVIEDRRRKGERLVGHSILGAEKPLIEKNLGIKMSLDEWDDSMLMHYLLNADFCKATSKDEDANDSGSLGFMNLWTTASMYTDVYNWKICRGKACEGPCPEHKVFDYCAVDAWASVESMAIMREEMVRRGMPEGLYRDLMEIAEICFLMEKQGIQVDMEYINSLESSSNAAKAALFPFNDAGVQEPFNPRSERQILAWAKANNLPLSDTTKKSVQHLLEKMARKYGHVAANERGSWDREQLDHVENLPEVLDVINRLEQFKSAGKGFAPWFDEKYRDGCNLIHPRFICTGTSTGRLASSRPNFQNIPARGFGSLIRAGIVPRGEEYDLLKADESQLELRMCLFLAGIDPVIMGADAFVGLVEKSNGMFEEAAALYNMSPRDIAKSVSHAADYLEGFTLLTPSDLIKPNVKKLIEYGALRVYMKKYMPKLKRDWEFRGGIVAFTGSNLADRLFGSHTAENRKKALMIQEDLYFGNFYGIREWQMRELAKIEAQGYVKSVTGRYLKLYGSPLDDAKSGIAFLGQGTSADYMLGIMLRYYRERNVIPLMQVHDELVFEIPRGWDDRQAREFIGFMGEETPQIPGFKSAYKAIRGRCWLEGKVGKPGKPGTDHIPGVMWGLKG